MTYNKQYLSYTGFKTFRDCSESYYQNYVLKRRPPMEDQRNVFKGNALHNLMEAYILTKEDNPDWIVENAPRFWNQGLEDVVSKKQMLNWKGEADAAKNYATFIEWAGELANLFRKHRLDPNKMMSEFKADLDTELGGIKFRMGGRIDVLTESRAGDQLIVLDLKASANKAIKDFDQVVWYSVITELKTGNRINYAGYIMPAFKEISIYHIPESVKDSLKYRVGEALQAIKRGEHEPTPEDKRCFWCPVKYACPLFGGAMEHKSGIVELGGGEGSLDGLL